MSDKLTWRNKHAILLREPEWAGIAARENYKIRADLRPLFEAHPNGEDLLAALAERRLFREGCEFIARMTHRRAAVWWAYCCLLSLWNERRDVESGVVVPASPMDDFMPELKALSEQTGIDLTALVADDSDANIDDFCKAPKIDYRELLADYVPPPQDDTAIKAASAAVRGRLDEIDALLPKSVIDRFDAARAAETKAFAEAFGATPDELFEAAREAAAKSPVTYTVNRADSPALKAQLALPGKLEKMRQEIIAQIKEAFPEQYPATPEAAKLLKAERDQNLATAMQAIWRWIVAPDERNTTLALEAGNAAAGTPEGMLAYAASWSFGDFAPEDKQMIPVPPELPGTGLNSTLLMLTLEEGGHRTAAERYELYFNMGLEVVYGRNLWPEAVMNELAPHQRAELEAVTRAEAPTAEQLARAESLLAEGRKQLGRPVDLNAPHARMAATALATAAAAVERNDTRPASPPAYQKWTPRRPGKE